MSCINVVYACMYVCVCMCMHVYVCVRMCMYVHFVRIICVARFLRDVTGLALLCPSLPFPRAGMVIWGVGSETRVVTQARVFDV